MKKVHVNYPIVPDFFFFIENVWHLFIVICNVWPTLFLSEGVERLIRTDNFCSAPFAIWKNLGVKAWGLMKPQRFKGLHNVFWACAVRVGSVDDVFRRLPAELFLNFTVRNRQHLTEFWFLPHSQPGLVSQRSEWLRVCFVKAGDFDKTNRTGEFQTRSLRQHKTGVSAGRWPAKAPLINTGPF